MKKPYLFLLMLLLAGLVPAASAQQNAANGIADRFFPALGHILTNDQRESLRNLIVAQRAQMVAYEQQLRTSRQELLNQITGGDFNETLARQYAEQSARAEAELTVIFSKALTQMQPPLSPRQIQQLKSSQNNRYQESGDASGSEPQSHMKLPPPLPHDTNDLPIVP